MICDTCADDVKRCTGNPLDKKCGMWIEATDEKMKESFLEAKYDETPHFYIRGSVECYSKKIIKRLEAKGGINKYFLKGCDNGSVYYIGPADGIIHKLDYNSDLCQNLIVHCNWIELT